jgi:hypothetical protein
MNKIFKKLIILNAILLVFIFTGCKEEETPTRQAMRGTWQLVSATDAAGNNITSKVSFPVTVIQLTDDNGMVGTQGPMFTRVVYGDSKWIEISAKMNQVFDYLNFNLNTGEFFVGDDVVKTFTVEAKLEATAAVGGGGLLDILNIMGVPTSSLEKIVYHKFIDVGVSFLNDGKTGTDRYQTMVWDFNENTKPVYNFKDNQGNLILWGGWPVANFSKNKFTFQKVTKTPKEVIQENL